MIEKQTTDTNLWCSCTHMHAHTNPHEHIYVPYAQIQDNTECFQDYPLRPLYTEPTRQAQQTTSLLFVKFYLGLKGVSPSPGCGEDSTGPLLRSFIVFLIECRPAFTYNLFAFLPVCSNPGFIGFCRQLKERPGSEAGAFNHTEGP